MILLYRPLFICIALAGAFVLIRLIPVIFGIVTEKPIARIQAGNAATLFELPAPGDYSIWQKTRGLRRSRIDFGIPEIIEVSSGRHQPLRRTGGMITSNDGSGTRRQLFNFSVGAAGSYRIEMPPVAAAGEIEDSTAFSLEIRKPMPVFRLVTSILGIIAGFAMLVGGIIGITLAGRIS